MLPTMHSNLTGDVNPATEALERALRNGANLKRSRSANLVFGILQVDAIEFDILSCDLSKMEFSGQDISKNKHQPRHSCSKRRCQGLVRTKNCVKLRSLEFPDDVKPAVATTTTSRLRPPPPPPEESVITLYKAHRFELHDDTMLHELL
jgi:hypothetical protein